MLRFSITWDSPVFRAVGLFLINTQRREKPRRGKAQVVETKWGCVWGKYPSTLLSSAPWAHTQRDAAPRPRCREGNVVLRALTQIWGPSIHQNAGPLPDPPLGAEHAPLRRAAASPAVAFIPINLLKTINELQHLQPSPSHNSSSPEGVSKEQGTAPSWPAPRWDGKESKDRDLLL